MQDASIHSHFKTPGLPYHDGAVGVPKATTKTPAQRSQAQPDSAKPSTPSRCDSVASRLAAGSEKPSDAEAPDAAQAPAHPSAPPQVTALRAQAHTLLAHLQHTDQFACQRPTIGPAAPYLAIARQWLATVAALPAPARSLLLPEQSLLSRLTLI